VSLVDPGDAALGATDVVQYSLCYFEADTKPL
jgi:hypothetical protein